MDIFYHCWYIYNYVYCCVFVLIMQDGEDTNLQEVVEKTRRNLAAVVVHITMNESSTISKLRQLFEDVN